MRLPILLGLALILMSEVVSAQAQQRIAFLTPWADTRLEEPLWKKLDELGWVRGQNITVDRRQLGDQIDGVPALATELLNAGTTVFVVPTAGVAARVREVTQTVPIVTVSAGDLVAGGLAASLAKPGGNVTGVHMLQVELASKKLALLRETLPGLSRVGLLMQVPGSESDEGTLGIYSKARAEFEAAARTLRIRLDATVIRDIADLETAFASFHRQRADAIVVFGNLFTFTHRKAIASLALKHRLPTMSDSSHWVRDGALMAYYPPLSDLFRLSAGIVDQILRGANPGDVPIQQPTTFTLSVNLRTAKLLRIQIPSTVLAQADEIVE